MKDEEETGEEIWYKLGIDGGEEGKLFRKLSGRIHELGIYLGLPEWYEIKYEGAQRDPLWGHLRHFADGIHPFGGMDGRLVATANHSMRLALDSIVVADMLGFGQGTVYQHQGELLVMAAMRHDTGKAMPQLEGLSRKKRFGSAEVAQMKKHVGLSLGWEARPIIADHHRWQKRSYTPDLPAWNYIKGLLGKPHLHRTPESKALSKCLGILDCHDSAATRANTRNFETPRLPSRDELRGIMLREYGRLKIKYDGDKLPKTNLMGGDLIEELFAQGTFGRVDPFNPYLDQFSFIRRAGVEETQRLRVEAAMREQEVDAKVERYNQIEHEEFLRKQNASS